MFGTLAVPAFAETTELPSADENTGIITITENADIDLNGVTVDKKIVISGDVDYVNISNGTITNGEVTKVIDGLSQTMYDYVLIIDTTADVTLNGVEILGESVTDKSGIGGISVRNGGNITIIDSEVKSADVEVTSEATTNYTPSNAVNIAGTVESVTIKNSELTGGSSICNEDVTGYSGNAYLYQDLDSVSALMLFAKTTLIVDDSVLTGGNSDYHNGGCAFTIGHAGKGSDITITKTTLNGGNGGVKNDVSNHGNGGLAMKISGFNDTTTKLAIDNCDLNAGKSSVYFGKKQYVAVEMTSNPESFSISNSTITANDGTGIVASPMSDNYDITLNNVVFSTKNGKAISASNTVCNAEVSGELKITGSTGTNVKYNGDYTLSLRENEEEDYYTVVATVNGIFYDSLDDALAAAQVGDTITLLADTSIGNVNDFRNDINLNEKTLTFTGSRYFFNNAGIDTTISNGTILANNITATRQALIDCFGDPDDGKTETITFSNVKFYSENYTGNDGRPYLFNVCDGSNFVAKDGSEFYIKGCNVTAFANNAADIGSSITFDNATITIEDTDTAFLHAMSFKDSTVTLTNVTDGLKNGTDYTKFVVDNTTITATGGECGAKLYTETSIEFINGSKFTANKILLKNDTAKVVNENDNSTINAEIITERIVGTLADTVKVVYEDVTVNEGEKVYDLYIEAEENTINRLTSAQFIFKLESDDDFDYVITSTDKITLINVKDKYMFNFDGITTPDVSGTKIKIGQIKFTGYGTFSFAITEGEAHATTKDDNIVTDYVVTPDAENENQGTLDITEKLENIEVKIPRRELTINITFPNAVEDNAVAYQDMKVTISGGDEEDIIVDLGVGRNCEMNADGAYVITKDLVYNTPYNVTVEGAGYRTAHYTVTMNDDKVLNFWNNAKDTKAEVEEGLASSAKKVTFLAGDLVKDGKINVYDLSAVVSYFGTINNVNDASEYARYDLNRDGKVDSKDVAYVLVSWGK